jgi:GNAT superfamily N-acetyltransferase
MSDIEIVHYKKTNGSPAIPILVKAWAELLEKGFISSSVPVGAEHEVFAAKADGTIVGVITFYKAEWHNCMWLQLGYVLPEYRNRGIYRKLWNHLVEHSKTQGVATIDGGVDINNTEMLKVAERLGRKAVSITVSYPLEQIS